MKVYFAGDHGFFELKTKLIERVGALGHEAEDIGAFAFDAEDDYPDFITPCAKKVAADAGSFGIIGGGSGEGEAMCANRIPGIRCAVFYGEPSRPQTDATGNVLDLISSAREHNDANMLSIGGRFVTEEEAVAAVEKFLATPFSGAARHARRIAKF
ncbi:MAG: RpiB/LacA/LacB family sugar-phosphate isomerase [Patescibacteria group bacterium]|nr:RpiB/LacA/LacB family sugar-phosphate isomerase [Patescibacteria group bacterium]